MPDEKNCVSDLAAKKEETINFNKPVAGHKFDKEYTLSEFINSYENVGFQATNLFLAIKEIRNMKDSKIFFGCTSNMITSGLRDTICYLAKNNKFNVFVTTGGGIEEDLIKCFKNTYHASFDLKGKLLRDNGYNRVGNLVIPNENYCDFETWLTKIVDDLVKDYTAERPLILTPSKFIKILGEKISNESSILYWCARNNINVYSPALTDGSIGDILTFYNKRDRFKLDIIEDTHIMNFESVTEQKTGVIVLGCGLVKHHILNANLFRNGADYCVLVNNAQEFDGSDAGANVEEAVSWGKLKNNNGVKVFGDVTIIFPLIVAGAFMNKE